MAIGPGADSPLWIPLFFFETAAIFVLALFANRENNSGRPVFDKICRAILPLPTLLIACKYGIVRMDYVHIIPAVRFMILIAVFCSAVPEKMALKWRCALLLSALLPAACVTIHYGGNMLAKACPSVLILFLSALLIYILNRYAVSIHIPRIIRLSFSTVFIVLAVHKIFLPWIFEQIGHYRSFSNHTPVVTAGAASSPVTADCFSHEMYLFRFNIHYSPRFVFQSYSAYTPELIRKNAAHFEYDSAPDYIFFGLQEIDGKFPTSFDSLSLLRIMNNYEPVPGNMLLRKKKNRPSPVCLEEIEKVESGFDCVIDLPRNAPYVWGSLDFHNSAAGFLLKNIIKPPSVVMQFTLENGQNISKIINPETSSVPFLLSPFLPSWRHLDILLSPGIKILPRVVRFSVYPYFYCFSYDGWSTPEPYFPSGEKWDREIGGFFFKDGFTVRFYRMVYSSPDKEENARP